MANLTGQDAVELENGSHHNKIHSLYLSTVQRSHLVTIITKAIDTTSIAINLHGYAAGGETYPVFFLQKNWTLIVHCIGQLGENIGGQAL